MYVNEQLPHSFTRKPQQDQTNFILKVKNG